MLGKPEAKREETASRMNELVLKLIDGMSPKAANMVIGAYNEMPYVVRDALDDFYNAKSRIDGEDGIDAVRESLDRLKKACEANEQYMDYYELAKGEANSDIADLYANGGMSV